jgi:exodeoxyribonuclease V gamma subunit
MLTLHFSNRTEALAGRLLQRLADAQGDDPFCPAQIIVPSTGLRRWLTLAIAREQGVCANVHFDFLAQWLWRQIARVLAEEGGEGARAQSPFDPTQLIWQVHRALADAAWVADQPRLAEYLARSDELMRYELSVRIAALLEPLVTYRADWLRAWAAGRDAGLAHASDDARADEAWQAALWRRLVAELGIAGQHPMAQFAEVLQRGGPALARERGLPTQVHVFAPPAIAPLHLQLLQQTARVIDVDLYVLNPCREYWFELVDRRRLSHLAARGRDQGHEEGNRLLAAWGRQTQALVDGLVELDGDGIADDGIYVPHPGNSLLAQVQNDILDLAELAPGSLPVAPGDRSLELHVCHSLTRELEVLHDRLLGLLAADPTLRPGDVLVVLPDLEAAAPLVDAVFGTAPPERHIPYALTGRRRSSVNAPARALLDLLALVASRLPITAVFGLLQQPVVARRFALDDEDLQQLQAWLQAAGAHWGLDAAQRAREGLPADARHTLADAMSRLFLGHALPASGAEPFAGLLPAADIAGSDALLLGRCWRFVRLLSALHAAAEQPQAPPAWGALLQQAIADFIAAAPEELDDLQELQQSIQALLADLQAGGVQDPLPLAVLRAALARQLDDPARGAVAGGGVTVAAMSPLRSLPFRVVAVLGLDDGVFPSPPRREEFDLLAAHPRRGDRQRRDDERNLFLDLLLAAREHLHLSHSGRSVRDNAPLPPSVLVADLLDTLVPATAADPSDPQSLKQARRRLVVEHPLQPFSIEAFSPQADPRLRSHRRELAEALQARSARPLLPPADEAIAVEGDEGGDDDDGLIAARQPPFFGRPLRPWADEDAPAPSLPQLIEFFRNPSRYLLRRRLQIELPFDDEELEDDEPFTAERRQRQALAERLLPPLLTRELDDTTLRAWAEAGVDWPAGAIGSRLLDAELAELRRFAAQWRRLQSQGELLGWRYDRLQPRDRLEAWIRHLALCAAAPPGTAVHRRWLARDLAPRWRPVEQAAERLAALQALYRQGQQAPLPFYPRSAWAWVSSGGSESLLRAAWAPAHDGAWGESQDRAVRLALRGRAGDPLDERFRELAQAVFGPLIDHAEGLA